MTSHYAITGMERLSRWTPTTRKWKRANNCLKGSMHIDDNTLHNTLRATQTIGVHPLYETRIQRQWPGRTVHTFVHVKSGCDASMRILERCFWRRLICQQTYRPKLWNRLVTPIGIRIYSTTPTFLNYTVCYNTPSLNHRI